MAPSIIQATDEIAQSYGNNHKDAWKECNRRLKKNPRDLTAGLWKLRLLSKDLAVKEFVEARNAYCKFSLDFDALSYIQLLTKEFQDRSSNPSNTAGPELQQAWFKRTEADSDKRLPGYYHMFETAYACQHWKDAQVAVSKLKAKFPDRLDLYFSYVALSQLASESEAHRDSKMAEMDGKLANMFVTQALQNIKKPASRIKADDPRQLRLAVQILRRQGRLGDILGILDDADIGIKGPLAKTDWEFVRVKIDLLEETRSWPELFEYCVSLLQEDSGFFSNANNDWAVWRGLQIAATESGDVSLVDRIKTLYETWKSQHPENWRNPWLSFTKTLLATKLDPEGGFVRLCEDYFTKYGTLYRAFNDLKDTVGQLSSTDRQNFQKIRDAYGDSLSPEGTSASDKVLSKWYICQVTNLKLDYLACVQDPDKINSEILEGIVCKAVSLYRQNPGEEHIASQECCILAATGLIHLDALGSGQSSGDSVQSQRYLLQALQLLDGLVQTIKADKDTIPDNRHVKLMLGILALRLGLGSFAAGVFPEVRIKDALSDSLAHYLLTRVSTVHPFASRNVWGSIHLTWDAIDPSKLLTSTLNSYAGAPVRMRPYEYDDAPNSRNIMTLQYDAILDIESYANSLRTSLSRSLWTLERRRIRRLKGQLSKYLEEPEELPPDWFSGASDNRSFSTLPSYEPSDTAPTQRLLAAPQPGRTWIAATLLAEETYALLFNEIGVPQTQLDSRARFFREARAHLASVSPDSLDSVLATELTEPERGVYPFWRSLRPLALRLVRSDDPDAIPEREVNKVIRSIAEWTSAQQDTLRSLRTDSIILPPRSVLETFYLTLEALRCVSKLVAAATDISKAKNHSLKSVLQPDVTQKCKAALSKTSQVLKDEASAWKSRLVLEGLGRLKKELHEGKTGEVVMDGVMRVDEETFLEAVKGASMDALSAVASVKIP